MRSFSYFFLLIYRVNLLQRRILSVLIIVCFYEAKKNVTTSFWQAKHFLLCLKKLFRSRRKHHRCRYFHYTQKQEKAKLKISWRNFSRKTFFDIKGLVTFCANVLLFCFGNKSLSYVHVLRLMFRKASQKKNKKNGKNLLSN